MLQNGPGKHVWKTWAPVVSEGFRCPACFQNEAQKQEQANAGVLTNIPALGGWPVTGRMLDSVGCGDLLWDSERQGSLWSVQLPSWGPRCPLSWI
jgi:hypothetical protein